MLYCAWKKVSFVSILMMGTFLLLTSYSEWAHGDSVGDPAIDLLADFSNRISDEVSENLSASDREREREVASRRGGKFRRFVQDRICSSYHRGHWPEVEGLLDKYEVNLAEDFFLIRCNGKNGHHSLRSITLLRISAVYLNSNHEGVSWRVFKILQKENPRLFSCALNYAVPNGGTGTLVENLRWKGTWKGSRRLPAWNEENRLLALERYDTHLAQYPADREHCKTLPGVHN